MHKININNQNISIFLAVVVIFFASLHGIFSYTVDSEIWSVSTAQFLLQPFGHHVDSVYGKPLFYLILNGIHFLPLDNIQHIYFAKMIFVLNFCALNFLFFQILKIYSGSKSIAGIALLFLLANPVWLAEGFRIRSDFLALTLSMTAMLLWLNDRSKDGPALFFSLVALSMACTPKSVLWNLPISIFWIGHSWKAWSPRKKRNFLALFAAIVFVLIFSYQLNLPMRLGLRAILRYAGESVFIFSSKIRFFIDLYIPLNFIIKSKNIWIFIAILYGHSLFCFFKKSKSYWAPFCSILAVFLFLSFSPKTAFLLCCFAYLLSFSVVFALQRVRNVDSNKILLLCGIVLFTISARNLILIREVHSNREQVQLIRDIQSYVQENPSRIFDSMGLLVRQKPTPAYVAVDDSFSNSFSEKYLSEQLPEIILVTDRIKSSLPDLEESILEKHYRKNSEGIYIRSDIENINVKISDVDPTSLFNQRFLPFQIF